MPTRSGNAGPRLRADQSAIVRDDHGPGQLELEIAASSWLTTDVDPGLIFGVPADQMWEKAIRRLGADPANLQTSSGVH